MEVAILVNDVDVSYAALLDRTRISYDSSRRITTANITLISGESPARYDHAVYDAATYGVDVVELQTVTIRDRRDNAKLFEGQIYGIEKKQTDSNYGSTLYDCDLSDYGAWLDRSVAWDDSFTVAMPTSDQTLIRQLVGHFCPQINTDHVTQVLPTIMAFEWRGKTLRQVLDDVAGLSGAEWSIDFDAQLHYGEVTDAPAAPYGLSTEPDYATTFPVRVDNFKRDFSNPVNHAFVRGGYNPATNILAAADYADPVSIQRYGEYSFGIVSDQITETFDAELLAKTTVLKNAYPAEQGSFVIWTDDLKLGQRVSIKETSLAINGEYIIRALSLSWKSKDLVEYSAQFGAAQPDLESYLRIIDQRTRWKSLNRASVSGPPAPGSVTDSSIAPPGLSAGSIQSVNANTIIGQITSGQIGSVNAGAIVGQITAGQIDSINTSQLRGSITADQIGGVYATSIQGSITAAQIGSVAATSITGSITASQIGSVAATTITGSITSGQIGSVAAASITGSIAASQIGSVNASSIQGAITSGQIESVAAGTIQGSITAGQIGSVNAGVIQGVIVSDQLANQIIDDLAKYSDALRPVRFIPNGTPWPPALPSDDYPPNSYFYLESTGHFYRMTPDGLSATDVGTNPDTLAGTMKFYHIGAISAQQINGLIVAAQIGSVNASTINGQIVATQIQSVNASAINGTLTASQIGSVNASAITGTITAGQIASLDASQITGTLVASQISSVHAAAITGTLTAGQIESLDASQITGTLTATQIGSITAGQITGQIVSTQIAGVKASTIEGAITAGQIASVDASQITGQITSGQISSIAAGKISGTIVAGQIGSIAANTITIGQLADSQIGSVSGGKIIAGSVTSDRLDTNALNVGYGGSKPGKINVYGTTGVVAQIGTLDSGQYGGWFQVLGAGGTGYASAKVYTDTSGNLFIKDANINISGQIYTSTTTFDPTYSTLALINDSSPDKTSHISRGLVVYYNGSKIGSLVRSPSGGYLELECTTGGTYVLISGGQGVRSDGGYKVGSSLVINASSQFVGTGGVNTGADVSSGAYLRATSGIYSGGNFVINSAGQFVGTGILTTGGVGAAGFNPTGGVGQTWNVQFRDAANNLLNLWINGVNYGGANLKFIGGVLCNTA